MFSRILFSTVAASLLTAAPAFAADVKQQCSCCSDGSIHDVDHPLREAQKEQQKQKASERTAQPRPADESPDVRNQSWGG